MAGILEVTAEQNIRLECLRQANQSMGMNGAPQEMVLEKAEAYAKFVIDGPAPVAEADEKPAEQEATTDAPVS